MTSIRARITLAVVGATAVSVALAALIVGFTGRKMLFDALDERLTSSARWFAVVPRWPEGARETAGSATGSPTAAVAPAADGSTPASTTGDRRDRGAGDSRDGRDGRDNRFNPPGPQRWVLVQDAADGAELFSLGDALPDGLSLAFLGVKPGSSPIDADLHDGRTLRVFAIASESFVPRSRGRGSGGSAPEREDAATNGAAPPVSGDRAEAATATPGTTPDATPATTQAPPTADTRRPAITWIAIDATETHGEAERLGWLLAAAWLAATSLAFGIARTTSRRVLAPVAHLSQRIAALTPQHLSTRVPMAAVPDELSPMIERLNALLARLESAFERERATIANMAHELRTPISALRAELEFAQFRDDTRPLDRRTMEKSLGLALRMQSLVNGLLTLSRIESGQETLTTAEVDVARLLREAWSAVEAKATERGLVLRLQAPDSLPVRTSSEHLAMVMANLLDNALAHGAAGDLDLVLEQRSESLHLLVENRCDRKTPPAENLFEPFWRQDPSRTGERHFGLGLALCDRVIRLLGGTIAARQGDGRFTVMLELPLRSAPASPATEARASPPVSTPSEVASRTD